MLARQILAKTRNSPNSPNIIARQNLLIYSIPLKSNNLYYGIKRKLGVIHPQFRMQCNLKGDLHSLHVVDDPVCICSNQIENCEHFFFHCYLYATQRVAFLALLREICSVDIATDLLLFGSNELDTDVNCHIF